MSDLNAENSGFSNAWVPPFCLQHGHVILPSLRHSQTFLAYRTCMHNAYAPYSLQMADFTRFKIIKWTIESSITICKTVIITNWVPLIHVGGQPHYQLTQTGIITSLMLYRWLQLSRVFLLWNLLLYFFKADTFWLKQIKSNFNIIVHNSC